MAILGFGLIGFSNVLLQAVGVPECPKMVVPWILFASGPRYKMHVASAAKERRVPVLLVTIRRIMYHYFKD